MTDRDKIIETMALVIEDECQARGAQFSWVDGDAIAERAYDALQASGMAVVPGWQSIESAPKGDVIRYEPACYRKMEKSPYLSARIIISNGAYPREASHWMPLPEPPDSPSFNPKPPKDPDHG